MTIYFRREIYIFLLHNICVRYLYIVYVCVLEKPIKESEVEFCHFAFLNLKAFMCNIKTKVKYIKKLYVGIYVPAHVDYNLHSIYLNIGIIFVLVFQSQALVNKFVVLN